MGTIRDLGIPLDETVGKHGLKTHRIVSSAVFTFDEVAAVYISRHFLAPMKGTQFWKAMESALLKMRNSLNPQMIRHIERCVGVVELAPFGRGNYQQASSMIDDLHFAAGEKRQVTILYQSLQETKPSRTVVDPYGLAFHDGSLYLIGFSHKRNAIRHWKIDRMSAVTVSNTPFQKPDDFKFHQWIEPLFGIFKSDPNKPLQNVRILFAKEIARQVREKHWHPSERFALKRNGSLLLELQLEDPRVMKSRILGYGRHAEVIEPKELRDYVRSEIMTLAKKYEKESH